MADYYQLIALAVAGLGRGTGEARRSIYMRARSTMLARLKNIDPSDLMEHRLALEAAIRKAEAECLRNVLGRLSHAKATTRQ